MELQESPKLTGQFWVRLYDPNGELKDERHVKNVVVTAGKNFLALWLTAATQADYFMRYLAIGTGVTGAMASDTALGTEAGTRVAGTLTSSTNVWQNQGTFGAANPNASNTAVTEAGIFSASAAGTMLARQTFAVVNKGMNDTLTVTWQITLA